MASASDSNKNAGTNSNTSGAPEGENIWNSILSEASQRSASDRLESRTVLVLGNYERIVSTSTTAFQWMFLITLHSNCSPSRLLLLLLQ